MLGTATLETDGHQAALAEIAPSPVAARAGASWVVSPFPGAARVAVWPSHTMKRNSFWQRCHSATFLLVVFLLAGVSLVFWAEHIQGDVQRRSDALETLKHRVHKDLILISDATRGALLDPGSKEERSLRATAESDLLVALRSAQTEFPEHADLRVAADGLRAFVSTNLMPLQAQLMAVLDARTNEVPGLYARFYGGAMLERDKQIRLFAQQVDQAKYAESDNARIWIMVALGGLALMIVGAVFAFIKQSAAVARPLSELVGSLDRMRQGDFCHRIRWGREDEFGVLGAGLDRLADDLSGLVGQVQRSGIQVNTCATEIAATAKQQQSTATAIAATTAEISATSKEISATSKELVKTMNEVSQVAEEATVLANHGQTAITRMEATMRQILEASGSITAKLAVLNDKTANINSVVTTITKVADQTNLLSLNAAIEAEKAGEYGLGFAVVAMEIRRLADQTAVATYDIEKMVKEMQSAVAAGVMGMDKFAEEARHGVEEIRQVSAQFTQIIHEVQTLTPRFQTVNEGMQAQATGAEQISETLTQLGEAAHQTAHSLRQSNATIEQLNDAARLLQTSVARFKLEAS